MNLKTIAQAAGVSTATVSNVINGNHHKVSQATIVRVEKIILQESGESVDTVSIAGQKVLIPLPFPAEEGDFLRGPNRNHTK
mgnify:CR=1 FL=1